MNSRSVTDRRGRWWFVTLIAVGLLGSCAPKQETEIAIELPAEVPAGLEFKWKAVRGADAYQMVFSRMTGTPVCTLVVAAQKEPSYLMRADSLPSPLVHGWQLDMEMRAMKNGQLMAARGFRPLKVP